MHMADALVSPVVAVSMYTFSAAATVFSLQKIKQENDIKKIPVMGIMGAFVFAAQMVNFSIPGTGASGHFTGGMLLSAILGPYAGFLSMIAVLIIQCLLFADGGLLALGCNIWNMAFYGCFVGAMIIWRLFLKNGISKKKIIIASVTGGVLTLQLGAFSVTLETLASGITDLPFGIFVATILPVHLAIGLVEGLITSAILCFLYDARPELLWTGEEHNLSGKTGKFSYKSIIIIFLSASVVTGGLLSLLASSRPDGLEWSVNKTAGSSAITSSGSMHSVAEKIQSATTVLPDYSFKNHEAANGTSFSGILGGVIIIVSCLLIWYLFRFIRTKVKK